jgi:hypothetical protein
VYRWQLIILQISRKWLSLPSVWFFLSCWVMGILCTISYENSCSQALMIPLFTLLSPVKVTNILTYCKIKRLLLLCHCRLLLRGDFISSIDTVTTQSYKWLGYSYSSCCHKWTSLLTLQYSLTAPAKKVCLFESAPAGVTRFSLSRNSVQVTYYSCCSSSDYQSEKVARFLMHYF